MKITKLQCIFLGAKRVNKTSINKFGFNTLSCVLAQSHNNYSTSVCTPNVAQCLMFVNRQSILSNNIATKQYTRIQNGFCSVSHPRIVSYITLHNGNKCMGYKTHHISQNYNNIRYLSTIDTVVETKSISGIFKTISDSVPVEMAQNSLLWIHDYTGLPWWSVIILTTIIMRTAITVPLSLYQQYILAKVENLKHEMKELIEEMKKETNYGIHKYNWSRKYARRIYNRSVKKQWQNLVVRENCHPLKASIVILFQIPLWISLSMSIRNLCYMLPKQDASAYAIYQEFTMDGFLWLTNLTVPDPFVLPIAMGLFNLAIIEINYMSRMKKQTKFGQYLTYFLRITAVGMIPIAMQVPSCVTLYWASSSAFGLFQNLILLSPRLRRFVRIPVTESESPHPYVLLRDKMITKYNFKRKEEIPSKT